MDAEKPTAQSYLEQHTPFPDWEEDRTWHWPFWKFGYKHFDALFKELHEEFNSFRIAIQDPWSWHLDVCDIAYQADTREEFLDLLRKRHQERFEELERAWDKTTAILFGSPSRWNAPQSKSDMAWRLARISRDLSLDSLIHYFGAYLTDETDPTARIERPVRRESQLGSRRQREHTQRATVPEGGEPPNTTNVDSGNGVSKTSRAGRGNHKRATPVTKKSTAAPKTKTSLRATRQGRVSKPQSQGRKGNDGKPEQLRRSSRIQEQQRRKREMR